MLQIKDDSVMSIERSGLKKCIEHRFVMIFKNKGQVRKKREVAVNTVSGKTVD